MKLSFVTHHGSRALRKRLKVERTAANVEAVKALVEGLPREEMKGQLRRFVDKKFISHGSRAKLLIFRGFIWVFGLDDSLITCYPLAGGLNREMCVQMRQWKERGNMAAAR